MAMTKKEREAFAALESRLRTTAALRWTEPVPCDIPRPPNLSGIETSGFVFNSYCATVSPAWSSPQLHGVGYPRSSDGRGASQNAIALYSTRLRALRGLRNAVEMDAAKKLADIDFMIETEERVQRESGV